MKINSKFIIMIFVLIFAVFSATTTLQAHEMDTLTSTSNEFATTPFMEQESSIESDIAVDESSSINWGWWSQDQDGDGIDDTVHVYYDIYHNFTVPRTYHLEIDIWQADAAGNYNIYHGSPFIDITDLQGEEWRFEEIIWSSPVNGNFSIWVEAFEDTTQVLLENFTWDNVGSYDPTREFVNFDYWSSSSDRDGDGFSDTMYIDWELMWKVFTSTSVYVYIDIYWEDPVTLNWVYLRTESRLISVSDEGGWYDSMVYHSDRVGDHRFEIIVQDTALIFIDFFDSILWTGVYALQEYMNTFWNAWSWDSGEQNWDDAINIYTDFDYYVSGAWSISVQFDVYWWTGAGWQYVDGRSYSESVTGMNYSSFWWDYFADYDGNYSVDISYQIYDDLGLLFDSFSTSIQFYELCQFEEFFDIMWDFYDYDQNGDGWTDSFDLYVDVYYGVISQKWLYINIMIEIWDPTTGSWNQINFYTESHFTEFLNSGFGMSLMWNAPEDGSYKIIVEVIAETELVGSFEIDWFDICSYFTESFVDVGMGFGQMDRDQDGWDDTLLVAFDVFWEINDGEVRFLEFDLQFYWWDGDIWIFKDSRYESMEVFDVGSTHLEITYDAPLDGDYRVDIHVKENGATLELTEFFWYDICQFLGGGDGDVQISVEMHEYDGDGDEWTDSFDIKIFVTYDLEFPESGVVEIEIYHLAADGVKDLHEILVVPVDVPAGKGSFELMETYRAPEDGNYMFVIFASGTDGDRNQVVEFQWDDVCAYSGDGNTEPEPSDNESTTPALPIPFSNFYIIALSLFALTAVVRRR